MRREGEEIMALPQSHWGSGYSKLKSACEMVLSALDNCALYTREGEIYALPGSSREQAEIEEALVIANDEENLR